MTLGEQLSTISDVAQRISDVMSSDNEIIVTETEREKNYYVGVSVSDIAATGHAMLIDLSDTSTYPHDDTGRIDFSALYLQVDRDSTAMGRVRVGVITRVGATNADVVYFGGIMFSKSDAQHIERDRNFAPSQIKTGVSGGDATRIAAPKVTNISGINTATPLLDAFGASKTPAVGDIVFSYERTAGVFNASAAGFYHGEVSA